MNKVSIIIPYFNNENTIIRALDSVKKQTFKDYEIIIINDGSKDKSEELVLNWIENNKFITIKHIIQDNKGPSSARNRGIQLSKCDFVAFLDADDSWDFNKLEIQIDIMIKNNDIGIIGSEYKLEYNNIQSIKGVNNGKLQPVSFEQRLIKNYFNTPSVVIRRKVLVDNYILFNEKQSYAEDTLLYLEVLRVSKGAKICSPLITLYKPELSKEGLSSNIIETEKYELLNYLNLYKKNKFYDKKISLQKLVFLLIFSVIKFLRRVFIVYLR
ncbi:glycosyltransferase family 2 protein [Clostridium perfringens]|uniref:glycosyltransferase family 2 protein n=1 Tax=Clostridium perfringens TaxID=1502 RepID=UPI0034A35FBE